MFVKFVLKVEILVAMLVAIWRKELGVNVEIQHVLLGYVGYKKIFLFDHIGLIEEWENFLESSAWADVSKR
ncbi:hypothetical protein GCM10020331_011360 [Ectobacillus funiculus]